MADHAAPAAAYRVLARKYRPTKLSELIGQDALVRTLTNALASGRIAHAFLLSGIRGVGKTTTARIIARALNCTGPDGNGGPTPEPCGACPSCRAIAEERPLDVIEMDAATRTGIDDIREVVDSVRYAPAASRFKVYIVDEVHMLSEKAFNGLLKTLEEPPPHAKFVFATTEARKVPVTVLSRCQRFDLKRVEAPALEAHLARIAGLEGVEAEPEALRLVAVAAEGSVRDSLSLLDQAIALADGAVTAPVVQDMLGLGDRARALELLAALLGGDPRDALDRFGELFALGAEPAAVLLDLLALAHALSRLAAGLGAEDGPALPPALRARADEVAGAAGLPRLARAWQMLLKGVDEVRAAPDAAAAAEMVLLRLACVAEVPPPGELARILREGAGAGAGAAAAMAAAPAIPPARPLPPPAPAPAPAAAAAPAPAAAPRVPGPAVAAAAPDAARPAAPAPARGDDGPASFAALVERLAAEGERPLAAFLEEGAHLISFEPGMIELRPLPTLPPDTAGRLQEAASRITGRRWVVSVGRAPGEPTLAEQREARRRRRIEELGSDPALRRVLDAFPGATIVDVRRAAAAPSPAGATARAGRAAPDGAGGGTTITSSGGEAEVR